MSYVGDILYSRPPHGGDPLSNGDNFSGAKPPPSNAEVRDAWSYTSILPYVFAAWCSLTQRNNFIQVLNFIAKYSQKYFHKLINTLPIEPKILTPLISEASPCGDRGKEQSY
jgi:hypothetical protein